MASRIFAIDLGAWSVKVVVAAPGLRTLALGDVVERAVPPGDEPYEQRAAPVLTALLRELRFDHDSAYYGVSGDQVFTHVLEFAFKSLRRPDLEKAVGAELEGVVPVELDDMVYAFEPIPADRPVAVPVAALAEPTDDDPTGVAAAPPPQAHGRVAPPAEGMRVLTYAMRSERAAAVIRWGGQCGAEPRGLLPIGGAYARLVERVPSLTAARAVGPVAVVDLGHERTDVVVVRSGRPVYSRTVPRGGRRLTAAIARTWRLPFADAERAKHADGFVASTGEPATSDAWQRVHEVVVTELAPLARDLRQTFTACRARTGATVGAVLLVGGGSRLRGIGSYLREQLGLPTVLLEGDDVAAIVGPKLAVAPAASAAAAFALGMTLDAAGGRPQFDLRQGPLAFKADLSFIRTKALQIAVAALVVIGFGAVSALAAHYKLRTAEKILTERLTTESTEHFGAAKTADEILGTSAGSPAATKSPLPKMTAYDTLLEINGKLPARDKVTLDVTQLDIADGKVTIKGSAKTPDEIDAIETALKEVSCLGEASRGSTQTGPNNTKQFTLTYNKTSCM
jgi:Tfp pilus assembly PilM family ATPase